MAERAIKGGEHVRPVRFGRVRVVHVRPMRHQHLPDFDHRVAQIGPMMVVLGKGEVEDRTTRAICSNRERRDSLESCAHPRHIIERDSEGHVVIRQGRIG